MKMFFQGFPFCLLSQLSDECQENTLGSYYGGGGKIGVKIEPQQGSDEVVRMKK